MSRGGARWGAGRPGWHAKAEASQPLDVRAMRRLGALKPGYGGLWVWTNSETGDRVASVNYSNRPDGSALVLSYKCNGDPREDRIALTYTRGPVGGARPWFVCPVRGERVAILYQRHGRFACRRCNRIAYASQSEDEVGRAWRRQAKIEARLAEDSARPTGMHGKTYRRLLAAIDECEVIKDLASIAMMKRRGWLVDALDLIIQR
jgi:hypothetical protein